MQETKNTASHIEVQKSGINDVVVIGAKNIHDFNNKEDNSRFGDGTI